MIPSHWMGPRRARLGRARIHPRSVPKTRHDFESTAGGRKRVQKANKSRRAETRGDGPGWPVKSHSRCVTPPTCMQTYITTLGESLCIQVDDANIGCDNCLPAPSPYAYPEEWPAQPHGRIDDPSGVDGPEPPGPSSTLAWHNMQGPMVIRS